MNIVGAQQCCALINFNELFVRGDCAGCGIIIYYDLRKKPLKLSFLRVLCVSVVRSSMTRA